ncbi:MAG: hypothetical protein JO120_08235, partial [Solirubrobacterales bacterium]|nr:hypothetical protein [Solirubrobacterales bacterium]
VTRPVAQQLLRLVRFAPGATGEGLLEGECEIAIRLTDGRALATSLRLPEGAPGRPPSDEVLAQKAATCLDGLELGVADIDWGSAASILAANSP